MWCRGGEPGATATHVYHLGSVALAEVVDDAGLVQKGQICNVLDAVELWMRVVERGVAQLRVGPGTAAREHGHSADGWHQTRSRAVNREKRTFGGFILERSSEGTVRVYGGRKGGLAMEGDQPASRSLGPSPFR